LSFPRKLKKISDGSRETLVTGWCAPSTNYEQIRAGAM
jgi:hypothetical protein